MPPKNFVLVALGVTLLGLAAFGRASQVGLSSPATQCLVEGYSNQTGALHIPRDHSLTLVRHDTFSHGQIEGLWVKVASGSDDLRAAVYTIEPPLYYFVLKSSGSIVAAQAGWNYLPLDAPVPVSAGAEVYLAVNNRSYQTLTFATDNSGPLLVMQYNESGIPFDDPLPASFNYSALTSIGDKVLTVFADVCGGYTPTPTRTPTLTPTPNACAAGPANGVDFGPGWNLPWLYATKAQLPTGTVYGIRVESAGHGSGQLRVGLYADNAGAVGALLAQSDAEDTQTGWHELALPPTAVSAGDYWLALLTTDGDLNLPWDASSVMTYGNGYSFGPLPASPSFTSYGSNEGHNIQAVLCPAVADTPTPSVTPTATPTATPSATASPTSSVTPTATATSTATPSATPPPTGTPTATATPSATPDWTATATHTPAPTGALTSLPPPGKTLGSPGVVKKGEPLCVSSTQGPVQNIEVYNFAYPMELVATISNDPCVQTPKLAKGMYLLRVTVNGQTQSLKVVIQ